MDMLTFALAALIAILLTCKFYLSRRKRFSVFKDLGIPGPPPSLISGNLSELIEKGAVRSCEDWFKKYGDFVGFYHAAKPMLLVKDLDLIKNIQIKDFGNFHGRGVTSHITRGHGVTKLSLVNVDGDQWKGMRSLLTPAFTSRNMRKMFSLMDTCSDEFLEVLDGLNDSDEAFEIKEVFQRLSLDVITRSAFGVQLNVQKSSDVTGVNGMIKQIVDGFNQFRSSWLAFLVGCFPEFSFIWKLVFTWRHNFMKLPVDNLSHYVMPIINMRRSNPEARREDLLQLMLNAETEEGTIVNVDKLTVGYDGDTSDAPEFKASIRKRQFLTNAEVLANALLFLVAGFETTSSALTFTTYLLAKFQDVQDRLRSEITGVLERDGEFTYDNVFTMRYLDQVISESLRMYPPIIGFITRNCDRDYDYNGLKIPAGMNILIPPYQIHHNPNVWNKPEKFDPERFSAERKGSIDTMAFQPFGNGPRNCVGMRFGQLEMKLTLAKMLTKYKFMLDERHVKEDHLKLGSTFVFCFPRDGTWLKVKNI